MKVIYEPKGRAREYAPLALNLYNGCDHACEYCYMIAMRGELATATPRRDVIKKLASDLPFIDPQQPVMLCFATDPYCKANDEHGLTRQALEMLGDAGKRVRVLSKGGRRMMQDADLFEDLGARIEVGVSLIFNDDADAARYEPGAAPTSERIDVIEELYIRGVRTFVSLEPVFRPADALKLIERTVAFVDNYLIGAPSFRKGLFPPYDKRFFMDEARGLIDAYYRDYYFKKSLTEGT